MGSRSSPLRLVGGCARPGATCVMAPSTIKNLAHRLAIQVRGIVDRHKHAAIIHATFVVTSVLFAHAVLREEAGNLL